MQLSVVRRLLRLHAPLSQARRALAAEAALGGPQPMSFTFYSPTEVFFSGASLKQVDALTMTGAFGILPAHVPILQVLALGVVSVFSDDGVTSKYFVGSGLVMVNPDSSMQLLVEEAYPLDTLDISPAKANLEKAQSGLSSASDEVAKAETLITLEATQAIVRALV